MLRMIHVSSLCAATVALAQPANIATVDDVSICHLIFTTTVNLDSDVGTTTFKKATTIPHLGLYPWESGTNDMADFVSLSIETNKTIKIQSWY